MISTQIHVYFRPVPKENRFKDTAGEPDLFLEEVKETKFFWMNKYPAYGEKPFFTWISKTGRMAKAVREASIDSVIGENRLVFYSSLDFIPREYEIYTV